MCYITPYPAPVILFFRFAVRHRSTGMCGLGGPSNLKINLISGYKQSGFYAIMVIF